MFPYIEIFGKTVALYGLMACVGGLAACAVLYFLIKKSTNDFNDTIIFLVFVGIGIFVGGHLMYGVTNFYRFGAFAQVSDAESLLRVLADLFGGSVFYGGLIGAALAGLLAIKLLHLNLPLYADLMGVVAPLFHGFARIGCFLGGCCYGIESELGFTAHGNPYVPAVNDVSRFPVQLLEAALNFMIFALILSLYLKGRLKGRLFFAYLGCYAVVRFFDEFLRGDEVRGFILGLSTSQFISILIGLCAVVGFVLASKTGVRGQRDDRDGSRPIDNTEG